MSENKAATKVLLQIILSYYVLLMKIFPCTGCIDSERKALIQFKQGLIDPAHRLASWKDSLDCCKWYGVSCGNQTRYVIQLDLRNYVDSDPFSSKFHDSSLGGRVNPALQQLEHLQRLDLSGNSFEYGIQIPDFLGSFQRLRYLNLSSAGFDGRVPQHIGNLSTLEVLDLSYTTVSADSLEWLAKMQSLKQLRMNGMNMTRVNGDWVQVIMSSLPSLRELLLSDCGISYIPQTISMNNFTHLRVLDLGANNFGSSIPKWVANITSLESIDLTSTNFNGEIPSGFSRLPYLKELRLSFNSLHDNCSRVFIGKWESIKMIDLRGNHIYGGLPTYLGNLSKLEYLDITPDDSTSKGIQYVLPDSICQLNNLRDLSLENTNLVGTIPTCFGHLSSLEYLLLGNYYPEGDNQLNGTLTDVHFEKLSKLQVLDLSFSGLKLNMKPDWVPPFQLLEIRLESCHFEGDHNFPHWLQTQKSVRHLYLSKTSISDSIPSWFWNFVSNNITSSIYLGQNDIYGQMPNPLIIDSKNLNLDLSHNKLSGPIPSIHLISSQSFIDLSYNAFTGPIPQNLLHEENSSLSFMASDNQINGTIPQSLGKLRHLEILELSNNNLIGNIPSTVCDGESALYHLGLSGNQLTGNIPSSMGNCSLLALHLKRNHLSGSIPSTLGLLSGLDSLHLSGNNLIEEIPLSLANCSSLTFIDLSSNKLVGSIPSWFSDSFPRLEVLSLRSNMFTGKIPPEISNLGSLQVLDLAQNFLHGPLPQNFQNFQAMRKKQGLRYILKRVGVDFFNIEESLLLTANGKLNEYNKILSMVVDVDLSDNGFSGEIPRELCNLYGLGFLNLSGNHFSGIIPQDIGNLHELQTLDLSRNQLSGQIPSSLSNLTFLQHLNLSHNRLHGMIPTGTQLRTFNNPSIYVGNSGLCGPPLLKNCTKNKTPTISVVHVEQSKDQHEMLWVYMGLGHGFVVGFCGFFGILVFKRDWRIALFRFFDDMLEWIITVWVLNISWLQKQIRKEN